MNLQDLGSLGELVAALATVGTLIYLAIQLKQNTKAARAMSTWEAENLWGHLNWENAQNPEFAELLTRVFDENTQQTDFESTEWAQVQFIVRAILQFQQSQYLLWRDGSLPTEYYETRKHWVRWFVTLPAVLPVLEAERGNGILYEEFDTRILRSDT